MKKLTTILLTAVVLLVVGGCTKKTEKTSDSSAQDTKKVLIWHTYTKDQQKALNDAIDRFNKTNEWKITVEAQQQDRKDFPTKVKQSVKNGVGPDIIIDYPTTAADYAKNGKVVDFNKLVNDPKEGIPNFKDIVLQGTLNEVTKFVGGGMYVFPLIQTGPVFIYDKGLYDELGLKAPKTWDELTANSQKIKEKYPDKYGFAFESLPDGAQTLIAQANNGQVFDPETKKTTFNTPEVIKWIDWYGKNVQNNLFMLKPTGKYFSEDFNSKLLVSYIGSVAGIPYLKHDNFEVAPLPQGAGKTEWVPAWNRSGILFTSNPAHELSGYRFLKFFASPAENVKFVKATNYASPYKTTIETPEYQEYLKTVKGLEHLRTDISGAYPPLAGTKVLRDELDGMMSSVATGTDAKTAVEKAAANADASLMENN